MKKLMVGMHSVEVLVEAAEQTMELKPCFHKVLVDFSMICPPQKDQTSVSVFYQLLGVGGLEFSVEAADKAVEV